MMKKVKTTDKLNPVQDIDCLVQEASKGSDSAFLALWKYFYPKVLNYLRRFTRDAEDVCSEAWIKIATAIKGFPGDGSEFQAWIFTIARNLAIDYSRKQKRRGTQHELREGDWIARDTSSIEITDLLDRLPRDQAEVIMLRVVIGFSVHEVSQITNKSESNIRVIAHRGLNALQKDLEASGYKKKDGGIK